MYKTVNAEQEEQLCSETVTRLDAASSVLAIRMESLHKDISDIKIALRDLTSAITKLALIEERLHQTTMALERAFDGLSALGDRVTKLEQQVPLNAHTNKWVDRAVVAIVTSMVILVARQIGVLF